MSARLDQSGGSSSPADNYVEVPEEVNQSVYSTSAPYPASSQKEVDLKFMPSAEVLFKGPFSRPSKVSILVVNSSTVADQAYVLKVLVTEPRRYLIRPNYALLEADSAVEVTVEMHPLPGPEALRQLLSTHQKLLFKWRPLKREETEEKEDFSPASRKSAAQENPNALFITCTTPISEKVIDIRFEPPSAANSSSSSWDAADTAEGSQGPRLIRAGEESSATPGGSLSSLLAGRAASLDIVEQDRSLGSGMIMIISAVVLVIAIVVVFAYVA